MDEQAAMMGDWVLPCPSPSPKAFVPSFLGDDAEFSFGSMRQMSSEDKDVKQEDFSFDSDMVLKPLCGNKSSSRGGLADRIAARGGFNAPRLNTKSIRLKSDRSSGGEVKSMYLSIPSGISPTAQLESPVFISNSLNQASPTTGKFQLFTDGNGKSFVMDSNNVSKDSNFDKINETSSFAFRPHREPALPFSLSAAYKASRNMNSQALSDAKVSVTTENTTSNFEPSQVQSHESLSKSLTDKESDDKSERSEIRSLDTTSHTVVHSPPLSDQQDDEEDRDQSIAVDSIADGSTFIVAKDGYHWRKYGQKQVKGSECPRSYYRCTYLNCPVRKKVESSREGQIAEVIYKGSHNHPKPVIDHVPSVVSSQFDHNGNQVIPENDGFRSTVLGAAHNTLHLGNQDWRNGSLEQNSTSFINPGIHHPLSSAQMQSGILESGDAVAGSSSYSNVDIQNDHGSHGSIPIDEGDESESKRRRTEADTFAAELGSGATRAIREPRVVVQTRSDVDILDDGYRWRKYGQKVVKGNPNPRSYYKCTYVGCMVRKHVERASNDHMSVITTYEGKHNHDVPAARNSSHANSQISVGIASQPQNIILPQAPPHGSFNRPMMQPQVLNLPQHHPHGFQMRINHSSLHMPTAHTYPILPQHQQTNGMSFMMPRGDREPNSASNLYSSNGYNHVVNNRPPSAQ